MSPTTSTASAPATSIDDIPCRFEYCSLHKPFVGDLTDWLSEDEKRQILDDLNDGWTVRFTAEFYGLSRSVVQLLATRSKRGLPIHPKGFP